MSWVSGLYTILWAISLGARKKVTVNGIANRLNYSVVCVVCTRFINVAVVRGLETHTVYWDQAVVCFDVTAHKPHINFQATFLPTDEYNW
jgi:hypothetical protein